MIFDYRYKPSGPVRRPSCDHNTKKLKCATLTASDVQKFYSLYYKNAERSHQNNFLLQHMKTTKVTRHRNKTRPPHKVSSKYFVRNRKRDEVPVCLKAFCQILQVNRFKLQRLAKKISKLAMYPNNVEDSKRVLLILISNASLFRLF